MTTSDELRSRPWIISRLHQAFTGRNGHIIAQREWDTRDEWATTDEIRDAMEQVSDELRSERRRLRLRDLEGAEMDAAFLGAAVDETPGS